MAFDKAKISIATHALQYGTGCFAGIRAYYNPEKKKAYIFRIRDHFERFTNSAKILGLPLEYSINDLVEATLKVARLNKIKQDTYIRPFLYTSELRINPNTKNIKTSVSEYMLPLGEYLSINNGLSVCVSSWTRISDNMIPARAKALGGYINSALAKSEAEMHGYDEAIMLNSRGLVSEGSAENLFIVKNGKLITPDESQGILEGITRRTIIELARENGIEVVERAIERTELYTSSEAFFSGTGVQVAWIGKIDGRRIGNGKIGPITKQLQDEYFKIVRGESDKHQEWLTEV